MTLVIDTRTGLYPEPALHNQLDPAVFAVLMADVRSGRARCAQFPSGQRIYTGRHLADWLRQYEVTPTV